jgi:hypothetical protein
MDYTKKIKTKWGNISRDNFREFINNSHNGVAILTGHTHFVIDFDELKYNPPHEIKESLIKNCDAIEQTPGGYHFWFKIDKRTEHFNSGSNITWNGQQIIGLDIRAQKGICYVSPSNYIKNNELKKYTWIKGDLSTATHMNSVLLEYISTDISDPIITTTDAIAANATTDAIATTDALATALALTTTTITDIDVDIDNSTIETFKENDKIIIKIIPKTSQCLVKTDYKHSQEGHSCFYLTKLKSCFTCTATCFSHGKKKINKELCDILVNEFWPETDTDIIMNDYDSIKEIFEQTTFKVLDPIGFYTLIGDKWIFREKAQLKIAFENKLLSDGSRFVDKWLGDPTMRTYTRTSYEACSDTTVFIFPPPPPPVFLYTTYTCEPNLQSLSIFDELLDILTNNQISIKTYILNWLAHLIQKPQDLPGVALIFIGQKGAGKDTLGDFFGEYIIGLKNYQNFSNQTQYFDKYDETKNNKFLIKVEEINKKTLDDGVNGETFKSSITSPTITINPKGKPAYTVKNYQHIIATSNNANSVDVGQKERRYCISVVSPSKIGDSDYWCKLRNDLFNPSGALAVTNMLLERDITQFNPRILPKNAYLEQLQEDTKDSVQKFIEQVDSGEYTGSVLYQHYRDYCTAEGLPVYTNTKFSTQLLYLTENGSIERDIERRKTNKSNNYIIN